MQDQNIPPTIDFKDLGEVLSKNGSLLKRSILLFFLFPIISMSGCTAAITFAFQKMETGFYEVALPAKAAITSKRTEKHTESISNANAQGGMSTVTKSNDILTLTFKTHEGRDMTAKLTHATPSQYAAGETAEIFYNPENPQDIRLASARSTPGIMNMVWKVAGAIFLATTALLILLLQATASKPGQ